MKDDLIGFLKFLAPFLALVPLVIVGIFGFAYAMVSWECSQYTEAKTKMMGVTCYVENKDGRWVSLSSYTSVHAVEIR